MIVGGSIKILIAPKLVASAPLVLSVIEFMSAFLPSHVALFFLFFNATKRRKDGNVDDHCADIYASFSVQVSPATTVDELIQVFQKCPEKEDRTMITTQMLEPFNPARIGMYDSSYKILSENPDATPNCTWNPAPTKTVS